MALLAHRTVVLDWALNYMVSAPMLKLGLPVGLALYAWLDRSTPERPEVRARRVAWSFLGVVVAIGLGRAIQDGLPPRPRPRIALQGFEFPPLGGLPDLAEWSSMPSDHAILVAALATAAWAHSRRLGLAAAIAGAVVVCFPRLYFGYHYLTDLLAGATFGVAVTWLALRFGGQAGPPRLLLDLERRTPVLVQLGFFLVAYEFIGLFPTVRSGLHALRDVLHALG